IVNPVSNATLNNAFTYTDAPTVTNLSPNTCPAAGGNQITVTGTGFVTGAGNTTVTFGAVAGTNVTVFGSTSLTVTCPAQAAGVVDVRVTTAVGTSPNTANDDFTYTATGLIPTITGISPAAGPLTGLA
ncbi:MAG TPA: IPT/TIG domain-containing protein, partial [Tepidiformaceae bacterium]|nr:IPT/TIG domain-containing protein [Tepidiformaceae bacterium]